jgi:hypothetical protein
MLLPSRAFNWDSNAMKYVNYRRPQEVMHVKFCDNKLTCFGNLHHYKGRNESWKQRGDLIECRFRPVLSATPIAIKLSVHS